MCLRRRGVEAQWQSPRNFTGRVLFRATLVEDYKTFWKDIVSAVITIRDDGDGTTRVTKGSSGSTGRRISRYSRYMLRVGSS